MDSAGIKHLLYPTSKTSNPYNPKQNTDGEFKLKADATFTVGSRFIVLDKVYSELQVGMVVNSPYTPAPINVIGSITSDGTYTTLEIANMTTPATGFLLFDAAEAGTFTIQIENSDGSIFTTPTSAYTAENITAAVDSNFLTVSTADASNIEVGMIIVAPSVLHIPAGTTVVAINGTSVTMSNPIAPAYVGQAIDVNFISPTSNSDTWDSYKSGTPSENQDDYQDDTYWPMDGSRYGLDPQHAQTNGSFYIDCVSGKIHFSSNISGKTVILDYISDSLGTDEEMQVHKFAEEAIYKWIAYSVLSTRANVQEYIVQRFKKERFAETRKAKLRLSNIKLEEITQILRGKSKQIKH